uniref:Uncharacterized protein n=1 Tax=Rhizophora mucronata TaxID=61149 RepID=A0A2P2Q755_RHIMU
MTKPISVITLSKLQTKQEDLTQVQAPSL